MHTLFLLFFFFSWAPQQLAFPPNNNRRILHEPFVPLDTLPPSELPIPPPHPPSPSFPSTPSTPNPKYPFSTTTTPNQSPFFPFYPSPPPPPPPPSLSTFATFPANISSLILPQSPQTKSSSRKLLPIAITSVACATIVVAISAFIYYRRRQKKHYATDDKAFRSESSLRLFPPNAETANGSRKLRHTSSTSSEFLYLGTVINSRGIDDAPASRGDSDGLVPRKMDSPELQPLPPLVRQVSRRQASVDVGSTQVDDEQEEFYSPIGSSLGGRESSSGGTGSGSRRVYSAIAAENFAGRSGESSSNSYSSSTSASPDRSHYISLSPPASSNPTRAQSKSSETIFANVSEPSPPPPPPALPPQPQNVTSVADGRSSLSSTSMLSSPERNQVFSPSLSPVHNHYLLSPSSKVALEKNAYASPSRLSNATLEKNEEMPRLSNASNGSRKSLSSSSAAFSLPSSPEKAMHPDSLDQSPRMSNFSDRFRQPGLSSLPLSPALLSSPERELNDTSNEKVANGVPRWKHWEIPVMLTTPFGQSATIDNVFDQIAAFPAPPPMPQRKHWEIPVLSIPAGPSLRVSPPPPPPPPPPPLQRQRKQWEVPAPSTPVGQTISRPPELIPPSRPFVLQNTTTKVSPVELPAPRPPNLGETEEASRPKLKPLHWDKVRASSDREMVWDQLKSSSFKLNEEMIETLFVVNTPNPKPKDTTPRSVLPQPSQEDKVLDPKKSQNIAILLRALNVTIEEVCEALLEGGADTLGTELLESLLKMAPSKEEERKLKEHKDDSPTKLGPAEKFLKAVLNVPFAFKRVEAMLYIVNFESEVEYLRKSFQTLEAACEELRNCRMFLKLLEAVLKTGNRMNVGTNRGDAQAFKLDTLLKLADVKGADGKTTLLHFVVQEIIRTEGARLSGTNQTPSSTLSEDVKCRRLGLQVVSSLSSELANVKKAAVMDSEVLSSDVSKLSKGIAYIAEVVKVNEMEGSDESSHKFTESMNKFIRMAEEEIPKIQAQESVALSLVKEITEYFHGNLAKEEAHPFRIFMVVRDFLTVLDRVCREVGMINERTMVSSAHKFPVPVNPMLPQPLPGLHGRQQYNSSDDDSPPP